MISHIGVTNVVRIPVLHKYPLGIEPGSLITGSKWVDHWTSGIVCECSEIAGSPQFLFILEVQYPPLPPVAVGE
jgi:hypothetical protein